MTCLPFRFDLLLQLGKVPIGWDVRLFSAPTCFNDLLRFILISNSSGHNRVSKYERDEITSILVCVRANRANKRSVLQFIGMISQ